MRKKIFAAIALVVVGVILFVIKTLYDAGEFKTLHPHFNGTISKIYGITGAEDITIDYQKRVAYLSADDRFATLKGNKGFGGIYKLEIDAPDARPVLMSRIPDHEIHPHGISLYKSPEGKSFLFVVDHTGGNHAVLLFRFRDDSTLVQGRSYRDSTFIISPNDVTAVDENRFYFTNDHGSRTGFGKTMEDYLQLKKSNVVYYDGTAYSIAAGRLAYANGINISRDGREVYVAATIGKSILVYHRDEITGELSLKNEIHLETGVDNIELDESGNLWVACHPRLLAFVRHASDTSRPAPSQVFKIMRDGNGNFYAQEIYLNRGDELSASSVAAVAGKKLLVGPVLDNKILKCEME
ncbi:MAG TPA: SMP-30/gluconolactonase/LRE family protein [Chitinophagales bacterium]|nr:SMP-30/gluconolactonase/LRE family protein [Chitinophagales bacterium]